MKVVFHLFKSSDFITTRFGLRTLTGKIIMAASSSYNVFIPNDAIPTAETKIVLADRISISPLGKFLDSSDIEYCIVYFIL
jgi:hypothetical protein